MAGSPRPAGTGNRKRDSCVEEADEDAPALARDAARRAAWDEEESTSSRRERATSPARRRSVKRRLVKRPGGPVTPAGGVSGGWEVGTSCGAATAARSSWASRGGGDEEDGLGAMARLGKPLATRPGCRGVAPKSQGFFGAHGQREAADNPPGVAMPGIAQGWVHKARFHEREAGGQCTGHSLGDTPPGGMCSRPAGRAR